MFHGKLTMGQEHRTGRSSGYVEWILWRCLEVSTLPHVLQRSWQLLATACALFSSVVLCYITEMQNVAGCWKAFSLSLQCAPDLLAGVEGDQIKFSP